MRYARSYFNNYSSKAYSEPCQTFKMESFAKIVQSFKPSTIFAKRPILNLQQGSENVSYSFIRFLFLLNRNQFSRDWFVFQNRINQFTSRPNYVKTKLSQDPQWNINFWCKPWRAKRINVSMAIFSLEFQSHNFKTNCILTSMTTC